MDRQQFKIIAVRPLKGCAPPDFVTQNFVKL